jgi:hypothetical protein
MKRTLGFFEEALAAFRDETETSESAVRKRPFSPLIAFLPG